MTIYLDVVFLENLFMNYIILFATALINKLEIKLMRIAISSFIGSLYALINITQILSSSLGIILKIFLSIAMIYIAFKPENIKKCIKQLLIFYLTSFTFGGVAFALLYFINPRELLMKNGVYIGTYTLKIALLGGIVGFVIITIAFNIIKGKINKKDMFCEIEIQINNKKQKMMAMLDTGNLLKEPITGVPVAIVEKEKLQDILPKEILENIDKIIEGKIEEDMQIYEYLSKFRVIPFSSLGKQNGLLLGIKADYIKIEDNTNENVIIGIYEDKLSKNNIYHALISLDMIEGGGNKNEYLGNVKI